MQTRLHVALVLMIVVAAGCSGPRTAALQEVHDRYHAEFVRFVLPSPEDNPIPADEAAFAETLAAIEEARAEFPADSPQAAHLDVLEGMVYLQTGQIGKARLLEDMIENAQGKLQSGTGDFTRDQLFARSFEHLLNGWDEIHKKFDDDDDTFSRVQPLQGAADGLAADLQALDPSGLADPEVDQGALYLATAGGIFYVWVFNLKAEQTNTPQELEAVKQTKPEWFKKGQDLIGTFLSQEEKDAAEQGDIAEDVSPGKRRYLEWYGFLARESR